MRVPVILLITLVVFVNSIVCSDNDVVYDEKHIQFGAHPDDFPKPLQMIPTEPHENANIRVLYDDGTKEPKEVVEKLDMIARGKTIIGHDGHSRGFYANVHPIFNTNGKVCFQHKDDRSITWPVPFELGMKWGLMSPSPSDPAYVEKNLGQRGETSRPGGEGMNVPIHNGNDKQVSQDKSVREDVREVEYDPAKALRVFEALQAARRPEYGDRGNLNSGPSGEDISRKRVGRPKGSGKEIVKNPVGRPKTSGISIRPGEDIIKRPVGRPKGSFKGKAKE